MVYLLRLYIEVQADGDGCEHIVDIVRADEMGLNLMPVETLGAPAELEKWCARDDLAPHIALAILAVGDETIDVALLCHLHQVFVVGIDEDESIVGCKEVVKLALGLLHSLETAETLQVSTTYVGNHTTSRFHVLYEFLDVARMGGSHFDDGNFMLGVQTEEGLGHAYVIIEVALGEHHVVFFA